MVETDFLINELAREDAIDQLTAIANSFKAVEEFLEQQRETNSINAAAYAVMSGTLTKVKNEFDQETGKVKQINGTVQLTNKSVDAMTDRFSSRIKDIVNTIQSEHKKETAAIVNSFNELIKQNANETALAVKNMADEFVGALKAQSDKPMPVVLTRHTSVRGRGSLKQSDLYDAGSGGGGSATVTMANYSNNQIAPVPASSVVVFSDFNSFSLKAKGDGVSVTVNGIAYPLTDGETFGWGVTDTATNAVTVTTDASSTAVAIYVDA